MSKPFIPSEKEVDSPSLSYRKFQDVSIKGLEPTLPKNRASTSSLEKATAVLSVRLPPATLLNHRRPPLPYGGIDLASLSPLNPPCKCFPVFELAGRQYEFLHIPSSSPTPTPHPTPPTPAATITWTHAYSHMHDHKHAEIHKCEGIHTHSYEHVYLHTASLQASGRRLQSDPLLDSVTHLVKSPRPSCHPLQQPTHQKYIFS